MSYPRLGFDALTTLEVVDRMLEGEIHSSGTHAGKVRRQTVEEEGGVMRTTG